MTPHPDRRRVGVRVEGTVQGVGFRPFVFRLAREEGLGGHVLNDERGVLIELEGHADAVDRLLARLGPEAPPLASVDRILPRPLTPTGEHRFEIRESVRTAGAETQIAPDTATCADCLHELLDPADRRHRYAFTNCTNCGPRLTIVRGVPYDRALTTMAAFRMCADCEREYRDPLDRRFHAQPNACPVCGPRVRLTDAAGEPLEVPGTRDPVEGAARRIADGLIVAVKGLGGYHLACDAADPAAVENLRARKRREVRPFALMVADPASAARLIRVDAAAEALLTSPARPIVLARRRPGAPIAAGVAPSTAELGVMLAYTPLHHALLADVTRFLGRPAALVMTSGNASDEPIAFEDQDACERLSGIADLFLTHNRPIHTRVDDSVTRIVRTGDAAQVQTLRRARGYVPAPLHLPVAARRPMLACGADLKSSFCLTRRAQAWVGHHIGDLEQYAAFESFRSGIAHFEQLFEVAPELVVHDLHPGYRSTAYALEREGVDLLGVQHHHAHLAACLAEHERDPDEVVVGAIYDGTGYGPDGSIWGGEILLGGIREVMRVGSVLPVRLPGGAAAIREPWRMACAWLAAAGGDVPAPVPTTLRGVVDEQRWRAVTQVLAHTQLSPSTTSMGRLFDAVAALCGIAPIASYEGQAAVELAARAPSAAARPYALPTVEHEGAEGPRWHLDPRDLVRAVCDDVDAGIDVGTISSRFHAAVAQATADLCARAATAAGASTVVLSGGVFQNHLLLETTVDMLARQGLGALTPRRLPCNDGGIAFGQAAIAAALDAG